MKMNFGLDLVQNQKLVLTKELKQSLEILQMNRYELENLINEEISENPTLEIQKRDEIDWEKYLEDLSQNTYKNAGSFYESHDDDQILNPESYIQERENLFDHLKKQLNLLEIDQEIYVACIYIIRTLDSRGYFNEDLEQAAKHNKLSLENFQRALELVQTLEPAGIGACNLQESLLLQLKDLGQDNPVLLEMIATDLDWLGSHKYKELAKKYNLTTEELKAHLQMIRSLNPYPARMFSEDDNSYILPDILLEKKEEGYQVVLNNKAGFQLKISDFYQKMLKEGSTDEVKSYIKDKLNRSMNLMKNLEQRNQTIAYVAQEIVNRQKTFMSEGAAAVKPMILKEIAEATGFHESTISRTVNGKYILTPQGLYELKYFFTGGVTDDTGEMMSSRTIKDRIRNIILSENKKKPYSDQKLCVMLNDEGINISRRTVAKYREEEGILSSSTRKEI